MTLTETKQQTANIIFAIVNLTVGNAVFVILLSICADVVLTLYKCPIFANT